MKKQLKKGFTLVELVIVIAVIAILAAVLIPTFAGVIDKSKKSAALQEATSANTVMVISADGAQITDSYIRVAATKATETPAGGDFWFKVGANGALTAIKDPTVGTSGTAYAVINNTTAVATVIIAEDLSAKVAVYIPAKLITEVLSFNGLVATVTITEAT